MLHASHRKDKQSMLGTSHHCMLWYPKQHHGTFCHGFLEKLGKNISNHIPNGTVYDFKLILLNET